MEECLFCKIARGEIESEIVFEDELVTAFNDINPQAPVHILIIPKEHIEGVTAIDEKHKQMIGHVFLIANRLASEKSISRSGFRLVVNSGRNAGQVVEHLHFHLLGGEKLKPI